MPEGPEIRREADAIAAALVGAQLARVEYRVPSLAARGAALVGHRVTGVDARGKAMLIAFDEGTTHYSHNQLYGRWDVLPAEASPRATLTVRVLLGTASRLAVLYSATEIALLDADGLASQPYLARLGPDVLDRGTTPAAIARRLVQPPFATRTLAALLLDQSFLAGIGNYLRSEILFEARIPPQRTPLSLDAARRTALAAATRRLPVRSYRTGGITNDPGLAKRLARDGVAFEDLRFAVYDRAGLPCYRCGSRIRRVEAGTRGLFFCPRCQRR